MKLMNDLKVISYSNQNLYEIPKINNDDIYELHIQNNNIKGFSYIPSGCTSLNLSSNRVSMIPKNLIKNFELLSLDLSHNLLISIQGVKSMNQLQNLNISNNYIPDDQLINLHNTNIVNLDLSNNNIKNKNNEISSLIGNMKSLYSLKLNSNQLSSIEITNESKTLENFEIEFNKLKYLRAKVRFSSLKRLSLQNNELDTIHNSENFNELRELILNDNFINNSEFLKKMKSLIKVNLNNNLLNKDISSENNDCYNIQHIEVTDNEISDFIQLKHFNNLTHLNLDNNKISTLVINEDYPSLQIIKLNNNNIESISFLSFLKNLSVCHLGFNFIKNAKQLYLVLSKLSALKEIFLVENDFNKGLYNIDLLYENEISSIDEYYLNIKNSNTNTSRLDILKRYRSDIIVNVNSILKLDGIIISNEEKMNSKFFETRNTSNSINSKRNSEHSKSIKESKNKPSQNLIESKYFIREKKYAEDMYETLSSNGSVLGNLIDKVSNIGKVNDMKSSKCKNSANVNIHTNCVASIDHNEEIINYASKDFDLNILSKSKQLFNNQNNNKADKKKHTSNQSNDNSKYNLIEKRIDNDYHTTNENASQFKDKKYNDQERRQYLKMNLILSENYDNENKNNSKNYESSRNHIKNDVNTIKSRTSLKSENSFQTKQTLEKSALKRKNSSKISEGSKLSTKNNPFKGTNSIQNMKINLQSKENFVSEGIDKNFNIKNSIVKEKENSIMINNDYKTTSIYRKKQEMWSKINSIKKEIDKEKDKIRNEIRESKILSKIKTDHKINENNMEYQSNDLYIKKDIKNRSLNKYDHNNLAYHSDLSLINEKNTQISNFEDIKEKLANITNNTNFILDNKSQASIKSLKSNKSSNVRVNSNGCKQFKSEDIDDLIDLLKSSEKTINIRNCYTFSVNEKIDFTINLLINSFWKINTKGFIKLTTLSELVNNLKEIYPNSINEINTFLRLVEADILQSVNLRSIYIKDLIMILTLKDENTFRFEKMFLDIYNKYNSNLSKFEATTDIEDTSRIIYRNKKIDRSKSNTTKNRSISPSIGYNSSTNIDNNHNKSRINKNKIKITKQISNPISDIDNSFINTGKNNVNSITNNNTNENENNNKNNDTSRFSTKILSKKAKSTKKSF